MTHLRSTPALEPLTRTMIVRAVMKAVCLFVLFNLGYGALQPVTNGLLPSLYNVLIPGRTRFIKGYEYDAYRLVSDHIVSRAQSTTFNIAFLGSSEIWGSRTPSAESIPAYMDRMGLVAADGRPVRVYNLGYPSPNGIKDLIILEALKHKQIPIDLVIISIFPTTLSVTAHPITDANRSLELDVLEHYNLNPIYLRLVPLPRDMTLFPSWNDRNALWAWAAMQMRGGMWWLMDDDVDSTSEDLRRFPTPKTQFLDASAVGDHNVPLQHEILASFAQFSNENAIPLIILKAPVPLEANLVNTWLHDETRALKLPLLDCWSVFHTPTAFEDYYHITAKMHAPYAAILSRHLTDSTLAVEGKGLPLSLPLDTVLPEESCVAQLSYR